MKSAIRRIKEGNWTIEADESNQVWIVHAGSRECCSVGVAEMEGVMEDGRRVPHAITRMALEMEDRLPPREWEE